MHRLILPCHAMPLRRADGCRAADGNKRTPEKQTQETSKTSRHKTASFSGKRCHKRSFPAKRQTRRQQDKTRTVPKAATRSSCAPRSDATRTARAQTEKAGWPPQRQAQPQPKPRQRPTSACASAQPPTANAAAFMASSQHFSNVPGISPSRATAMPLIESISCNSLDALIDVLTIGSSKYMSLTTRR